MVRTWGLPLIYISIFISALPAFSQEQKVAAFDTSYTREVLNTLASSAFSGRGYVRNGDKKASKYIRKELKRAGVKFFRDDAYQEFSFPVNIFPDGMDLGFCNDKLKPGIDYLIHPGSPALEGQFAIQPEPTNEDGFMVLREEDLQDGLRGNHLDSLFRLYDKATGFIVITGKKLTWWVAGSVIEKPVILLSDEAALKGCRTVTLDVESAHILHDTRNVIGYVPGSEESEHYIVVTGHYDHLGMMGSQALFNGANDNASGIALMLTLARYYADPAHSPRCSVVFMAFAGEEAGLRGSEYYVNNPVFPLERTRFLLNLDLMGTGEEGITVVNGSVHPKEFELLTTINDSAKYFSMIGERGRAANSDHYHFSEKGVPAFFIYTMGPRKAYHDVHDVPGTVEFPKVLESLQLINSFIKRICPADQR